MQSSPIVHRIIWFYYAVCSTPSWPQIRFFSLWCISSLNHCTHGITKNLPYGWRWRFLFYLCGACVVCINIVLLSISYIMRNVEISNEELSHCKNAAGCRSKWLTIQYKANLALLLSPCLVNQGTINRFIYVRCNKWMCLREDHRVLRPASNSCNFRN